MKTFTVFFLAVTCLCDKQVVGTLPSSSSSSKRVAVVTGGCRGIGRGISGCLAASGEYDALILTYNTNQKAAEEFKAELLQQQQEQQSSSSTANHLKKVELVGGDLSTKEARDAIFDCFDNKLGGEEYELATVIHNAGQYLGVTADNVEGITAPGDGNRMTGSKKFGTGSLINEEDGSLDTTYMDYYQKLYGTAFVDICERSLVRMKRAYEKCQEAGIKYRGSIVGISSPGCNHNTKPIPGYDMPGSGKCVMEYSMRLYALEAAKYGINCNVVIPGVTRSDAWGKVAESMGTKTKDEFLNEIVDRLMPINELMEATDIGETIQFLTGKISAGRFITGLSLRVDGGNHLK